MPIKFSDHAKFQLRKRHISQRQVLDVVRNSEEIRPSYKNRRLRRKLVGGKILQTVTITEGSKITVISGYFLRRDL
ncbi:hypothetical protein A3D79_01790 [Candidatus Daviesbacteria bacterium RIFCSPHIGHO2_02_FULL_39_8]|nr:MAG: hypothetical protein A3D79_01790 [Candidatus Daviesbacteria bacterium RIFCSPHIGHO2_02_FULL_39_8]